jgi:molybdopterin-guanine dinucleotide biosynthesis protein
LVAERGREVAVNVQFADDLAADKHGHDDFRFSFGGASQVAVVED